MDHQLSQTGPIIDTEMEILPENELLCPDSAALTKLELSPSGITWEMELGPFTVSMAHPKTIEDKKTADAVLSWCDKHDKAVEECTRLEEPTEYFAKKCFQSLHLVYSGSFSNIKAALANICNLKKVLADEDKVLDPRYGQDGFAFVIESTHRQIKLASGCPRKFAQAVITIAYENLTELGKATVMATASAFLRCAKLQTEVQTTLIEQALKVGSNVAEWHHLHFNILRSIRRDDELTFKQVPSLVEASAVGNAYNLNPDNTHIVISVYKTLFDFIKYAYSNTNGVIKIGPLSWPTRMAALESLCSALRDLALKLPDNLEVQLLAASVFISGRLPHSLQDGEFAKNCLDTAHAANQSNAKLFRRLGVWHLMQDKDLEAAKAYFTKAMELEPHDYLPAIDYLWVHCREMLVDSLKDVDMLLKRAIEFKWPHHALTDIYFAKACVLLGMGKEKLAALAFKESYKCSAGYFETRCHTLKGSLRRAQWKLGSVTLEKALACLGTLSNSEEQRFAKDSSTMTEIIRVVEKVCEQKTAQAERSESRGWASLRGDANKSENWRFRPKESEGDKITREGATNYRYGERQNGHGTQSEKGCDAVHGDKQHVTEPRGRGIGRNSNAQSGGISSYMPNGRNGQQNSRNGADTCDNWRARPEKFENCMDQGYKPKSPAYLPHGYKKFIRVVPAVPAVSGAFNDEQPRPTMPRGHGFPISNGSQSWDNRGAVAGERRSPMPSTSSSSSSDEDEIGQPVLLEQKVV